MEKYYGHVLLIASLTAILYALYLLGVIKIPLYLLGSGVETFSEEDYDSAKKFQQKVLEKGGQATLRKQELYFEHDPGSGVSQNFCTSYVVKWSFKKPKKPS